MLPGTWRGPGRIGNQASTTGAVHNTVHCTLYCIHTLYKYFMFWRYAPASRDMPLTLLCLERGLALGEAQGGEKASHVEGTPADFRGTKGGCSRKGRQGAEKKGGNWERKGRGRGWGVGVGGATWEASHVEGHQGGLQQGHGRGDKRKRREGTRCLISCVWCLTLAASENREGDFFHFRRPCFSFSFFFFSFSLSFSFLSHLPRHGIPIHIHSIVDRRADNHTPPAPPHHSRPRASHNRRAPPKPQPPLPPPPPLPQQASPRRSSPCHCPSAGPAGDCAAVALCTRQVAPAEGFWERESSALLRRRRHALTSDPLPPLARPASPPLPPSRPPSCSPGLPAGPSHCLQMREWREH